MGITLGEEPRFSFSFYIIFGRENLYMVSVIYTFFFCTASFILKQVKTYMNRLLILYPLFDM